MELRTNRSIKLTVAQAIVRFLQAQKISRDHKTHQFFEGMWGIFGHGNVAGIGQALEENKEFPYYQARNEQGMVHAAAAFAKQNRRLKTFACTSSIGPGATNMITAAAGATINRLPVLLLPGDAFARRTKGPVLQQLEHSLQADVTVNDCFKPISKYWDRITRPEQVIESFPAAMRVLTDQSETGAVTIALPQDIQSFAYDYPEWLFEETVYQIYRQVPHEEQLNNVLRLIRSSKKPLIIAGGGVIYSEAEDALKALASKCSIPVAETQAGKGTLDWDHPFNMGAIGATGTSSANQLANDADLVIVIGSRLSDFTTGSGTLFENPKAKFISINCNAFDSYKFRSLPLQGDAKACIEKLTESLGSLGYQTDYEYANRCHNLKLEWENHRQAIVTQKSVNSLTQGEIIGIVNQVLEKDDTILGAAGSLPGDLHKLINVRAKMQYHMEYGYSCMGYEIAGGLGAKLAKSQGDVFVMVGDGSYLMMHTELLTAIQENQKLIVLMLNNGKFACIDKLSRACGSKGFGNEFRLRNPSDQQLSGDFLNIDYVKNAESLGAKTYAVNSDMELQNALQSAKKSPHTSVIVVSVDSEITVPGFNSKWEVAVAETSSMDSVVKARKLYEQDFLS